MDRLYSEHDKIMLLKTGQVLTVHADLSNHLEPGIIVKEKVGRLISRAHVRPAGRTRMRWDLEKHIQEPDLAPPPPPNTLQLHESDEWINARESSPGLLKGKKGSSLKETHLQLPFERSMLH